MQTHIARILLLALLGSVDFAQADPSTVQAKKRDWNRISLSARSLLHLKGAATFSAGVPALESKEAFELGAGAGLDVDLGLSRYFQLGMTVEWASDKSAKQRERIQHINMGPRFTLRLPFSIAHTVTTITPYARLALGYSRLVGFTHDHGVWVAGQFGLEVTLEERIGFFSGLGGSLTGFGWEALTFVDACLGLRVYL
jgi:hypothetical protein